MEVNYDFPLFCWGPTVQATNGIYCISVPTSSVMLSYHKAELEVQQQSTTVTVAIVNILSNWQI